VRLVALAVCILLPGIAACGGDDDQPVPSGPVAAALADAGYFVDEVSSGSAFEPEPERALAVEDNGIPSGGIVGIEFAASKADAEELGKGYEKIDASVEVLGDVVISGLPPVTASNVTAVADASGL
jgi:hypothetical protein